MATAARDRRDRSARLLRRRATGRARRHGLRPGPPVDGRPRHRRRPLPYRPITGDLLDEYSLLSILEEVRPDRIFNFGAQSFIPSSWTQPILTAQYTGLGVVRLLEAVRRAVPDCRVLQAGSSELFAGRGSLAAGRGRRRSGRSNPYGIAKAFAYHTVRAYRRQYKQFATNVDLLHQRVAAPHARVRVPQGDPRGRRDRRRQARHALARATSIPSATGATRPSTRRCRSTCSIWTRPTTS